MQAVPADDGGRRSRAPLRFANLAKGKSLLAYIEILLRLLTNPHFVLLIRDQRFVRTSSAGMACTYDSQQK